MVELFYCLSSTIPLRERRHIMKTILIAFSFLLWPLYGYSGPCNYPDDRDSAGRRCGGRAASVRPGGRLGGDGKYTDSQGRARIYGPGNDKYDSGSPSNNNNNGNSTKNPFLSR